MLPHALPRPTGVEFGAAVRPLQYLAGDFYSVFRLDRHRVGFYLGDVVGHGAAAALLSVFVMQAIRPTRMSANSYEVLAPSVVMEQLNLNVIAAAFPNEPFLTMIYGVLDLSLGTCTYCSCGHPPAMVLRPGESPTMLEATAPLLGVFDAPFREEQVTLAAGDRLVLYSDGATMASWGSHGEGITGLASCMGTRDGRSPQSLVDMALSAAAFDGKAPDDITLLIAQIDR
jgi:phosphoserine phosphatase RsbU/P